MDDGSEMSSYDTANTCMHMTPSSRSDSRFRNAMLVFCIGRIFRLKTILIVEAYNLIRGCAVH
jgi:hypothetical protein